MTIKARTMLLVSASPDNIHGERRAILKPYPIPRPLVAASSLGNTAFDKIWHTHIHWNISSADHAAKH